MIILYLTGKGSASLLKLGGGHKTIYEITFTFSNVTFIGLPINQIVFGHTGLPPLFAYYIMVLPFFWGFGASKIASASTNAQTAKNRPSATAAKIFNPGFIAVLIGYGLVQAGLSLPLVLDMALSHLANLTVPLSLLVIGSNLTIFAKGIPRVTKDEILIMIGKFVISPLVMLALLKSFGITGMPFYVFLLSSSMPCHMQTSILAQQYNVCPEYSSKLVGLSTLLSIGTIPCYVALIHTLMA